MIGPKEQSNMSKIDKDELYQHLSGFLKTKGVELGEGVYTRRIQQGCHLLADTINGSQKAVQRAKAEVGKRLDQVRQVIHERTAPRTAPDQPPPRSASSAAPPRGGGSKGKTRKPAAPKPKAGTRRGRSGK
jgi:hypothetical protein